MWSRSGQHDQHSDNKTASWEPNPKVLSDKFQNVDISQDVPKGHAKLITTTTTTTQPPPTTSMPTTLFTTPTSQPESSTSMVNIFSTTDLYLESGKTEVPLLASHPESEMEKASTIFPFDITTLAPPESTTEATISVAPTHTTLSTKIANIVTTTPRSTATVSITEQSTSTTIEATTKVSFKSKRRGEKVEGDRFKCKSFSDKHLFSRVSFTTNHCNENVWGQSL